jgi:hypothetical protein
MFQEDYLLRQISQLVAVLQRALGLMKSDQAEAALEMIDHAFEDSLGIKPDLAVRLTREALYAVLTSGVDTPGALLRLTVAAALFNQRATIYALQDRPDDSYLCRLSALDLGLEAKQRMGGQPLPDHAPAIDGLLAELEAYQLPTETYQALLRYFETSGQFAQAEEILYEMIEADPANDALPAIGIDFYQRLLKLTDVQLSAGELPRDEVQAGLEELESRST